MSAVLKELGFTQAEMQEKVIERICDRLLNVSRYEDGEDWAGDSAFKRELDARIKTAVDAKVDAIATEHVLPKVGQHIEELTLQETNKWGEKKGEPVTFVEYLIQRADVYMQEQVNHNGKTKGEDSYSWRASTTRISYMIDQHLQYAISTAMQKAMQEANKSIVGGLEKAIRLQLNRLHEQLKITVKV